MLDSLAHLWIFAPAGALVFIVGLGGIYVLAEPSPRRRVPAFVDAILYVVLMIVLTYIWIGGWGRYMTHDKEIFQNKCATQYHGIRIGDPDETMYCVPKVYFKEDNED